MTKHKTIVLQQPETGHYQAVCSCGHRGELRQDWLEAMQEKVLHQFDVIDEAIDGLKESVA